MLKWQTSSPEKRVRAIILTRADGLALEIFEFYPNISRWIGCLSGTLFRGELKAWLPITELQTEATLPGGA